MANRKKLSWASRETIEQKINALGGDEALSKQATKLVLSPYRSKIEQNGLSITFLQKKLIIDKIIDGKYLSKILASTIGKNCLQKSRNITYRELEELINDQCIVGKGISAATCKRFRLGEKIDAKAFDILCKTLEESPENICEKEQPIREILKQEEELNLALSQFNHYSERMNIRERKYIYSSLYLHKFSQEKSYSCHWLLKSLMIEKSQRCDHLTIELDVIEVSSKLKTDLGDKLLQKIRESLRNIKSSQFKFKITKNSNMEEVVLVLQQILKQQNIIFLVQSLDIMGVKNEEVIIQQFWNLLTAHIESTEHHLFLCFVSAKEIECTSIGYNYLFKVDHSFKKEDLRSWLKNPNYNKLYKPIKNIEHIDSEVERIWNKCQGENDRLLEEIHQACDCQIEETLWQRI